MPGDGLIANPVEKNVAFVVYNLLQTELVHCRATGVPPRFDILSAWVSDVMFPSSAFGFDSNIISAFMDSQSKKGTTVEIVRLLQRFGGRSRVVALDYFSTARNWKNPEVEDMHPTGRIELCDWDLRELGVLIEFAKSGAEIYLHSNLHDKLILTTTGAYSGTSNYTKSGYYITNDSGTVASLAPGSSPNYKRVHDLFEDRRISSGQQDLESLIELANRLASVRTSLVAEYETLAAEYARRHRPINTTA